MVLVARLLLLCRYPGHKRPGDETWQKPQHVPMHPGASPPYREVEARANGTLKGSSVLHFAQVQTLCPASGPRLKPRYSACRATSAAPPSRATVFNPPPQDLRREVDKRKEHRCGQVEMQARDLSKVPKYATEYPDRILNVHRHEGEVVSKCTQQVTG